MARHAFEPLRPELAALIRPGDLIVAGRNFGCGSSREQAPEILLALGVAAVVARGFARIFYRNALNNGLLVLEQAELSDVVAEGDMLTIDVARGTVEGRTFTLPAMPEYMAAMLDAGGLVAYHRVRNGARA
jgi:3-isopropylmalate/(R)-2-methylmalate dehydratase small subunit